MNRLNNVDDKFVLKNWGHVVENMGIKDPDKVLWMSRYCHNHALRDSYVSGSALNESSYQSLAELPGMGNINFPANPGTSSQFYTNTPGSGDKFNSLLPLSIQVAARTIAFDIVPVSPMENPSGLLAYVDYVYGNGALDSTTKPIMIKINAGKVNSTEYVVGTTYWGVSADSDDTNYSSSDKAVKMVYVGKSRIDGHRIFKVVGTYAMTGTTNGVSADDTITIADVFDGSAVITDDNSSKPHLTQVIAVTASPELVQALADHIANYVGAGETDTDNWVGNEMTGADVIAGMSRNTGEHTYPRPLTPKVYTKSVAAKTVQVYATASNEQIDDLKRQHGIDIIKMLENVLANEISQHISKNIMSRLFALGWQHNLDFYNAWSFTLNNRLDGTTSDTTSPTYILSTGGSSTMPVLGQAVYTTNGFENQVTMQRRIITKIYAASQIIAVNGRLSPANFVVTNSIMAAALSDASTYTTHPYSNTTNPQSGSLYPVGKIGNMTHYVDPYMGPNDSRILVGRKGTDREPGLIFMPYLMAEQYQVISEGTFSPKVAVRSRYALVEAGQYPQFQYYTFYIKMPPSNMV